MVEVYGQRTAAELADDGSHGGACHAHVQHEDKHGVQHDVDDSAQTLSVHTQQGAACALKQPLVHDLAEHAQRADGDDAQVLAAHLDDVLHLGLGAEEQIRAGQAQHGGDEEAHHGQEDAVVGHAVGPFPHLCAQSPAHQGVDTHGGTGGKTDHQVLGGEGQGYGSQRLFADAADEYAVHDVIKRLHQHGRDDGQGHVPDQLGNGHNAQLVFILHSGSFWLIYSQPIIVACSAPKGKPRKCGKCALSGHRFWQKCEKCFVMRSIYRFWKKLRISSAVQAALPWAKPSRPPPRPWRAAFMSLTRGRRSPPLSMTAY